MHKIEETELSKKDIANLILEDKDEFYVPYIMDVGSYDGEDSRELVQTVGKTCIVDCFEADPRNRELFLTLNEYEGNLKLNLFGLALCNKNGQSDFYLSDSDTRRHFHNNKNWSASSSLKEPNHHLELFKDVKFENKVEVDCMKLDTFYKPELYKKIMLNTGIDFIWCDINGAEEDFILGGLETLQNHTRYLYIEFSDKELYKGQITKNKILELLPNFELIGIYNFPKDLGNFGNLLLKNKTL